MPTSRLVPWSLASLLVVLFALAATSCGEGTSAPPIVAFTVPKNPHLANSTWPIFHRDSYAQHSSELSAPTGARPITFTTVTGLTGLPIFTLFDSHGDIFSVVRNLSASRVCKVTAATLTVVDCVDVASTNVFGGAYAYVDAQDRLVVGSGQAVLRYTDVAGKLVNDTTVDVSAALDAGEALAAVTVRYSGELVFAGDHGSIGMMPGDLSGPPTATLKLAGEEISNAISTDTDGAVYAVTSRFLHRLDVAGSTFVDTWKDPIAASSTTPRPGRLGIGSGTTPSLVMDDMVTVADDADSMNLVVVRRGVDVGTQAREVCKVPVFDGPATTDNAIVVAGRTLILEQNLDGYGGVARFDVGTDGTCTRTWVSPVVGPSCVPTLSKATNLVYVYTNDPATGDWGLTGLDLATGATRFHAVTGSGTLYDNHYAAVTIGPDGRVYIGTFGGLIVFEEMP